MVSLLGYHTLPYVVSLGLRVPALLFQFQSEIRERKKSNSKLIDTKTENFGLLFEAWT